MTSDRTLAPDTKVETATFLVGWELCERLAAEYGDRAVFSDDSLTLVGLTLFVPLDNTTSVRDVVARIFPPLRREIAGQLDELRLPTTSLAWSVEFDYQGHPVAGCGVCVDRGILFEAMVKVRDRSAIDPTYPS